jgi:predicted nucleic acid-binding protein
VIAYLDASVVLRVVFGEAQRLSEWNQVDSGVSSALTRVECLRVIDRLRLRSGLDDEEVSLRRIAVAEILDRVVMIPISATVLRRASEPFPTGLGTLDAIHLASVVLWQQSEGKSLELCTHDSELGRAARAMGMTVWGCS